MIPGQLDIDEVISITQDCCEFCTTPEACQSGPRPCEAVEEVGDVDTGT